MLKGPGLAPSSEGAARKASGATRHTPHVDKCSGPGLGGIGNEYTAETNQLPNNSRYSTSRN